MNGFSNATIKDKLCGGCDCTGFAAAVNYTHDPAAKTILLTDASTYPTGDSRKIVHLRAIDKNGKEVRDSIAAADVDNAITLNVATLDASGGLSVTATVVTTKGCISDGRVDGVGVNTNAGALGYWDKDNNSLTV